MLGRSVIPEHDRAGRPAEPELIFRHTRLRKQYVEYRGALCVLQVFDAQSELWIDVDALSSGHGMRPHDRMRWIGEHVFHPVELDAVFLRVLEQDAEILEIVHRPETGD